MNWKGTQTEKHLLEAIAGGSLKSNEYDLYASAAKKEGYQQIAWLCEETVLYEKEHAKRLGKSLGIVQTTAENLEDAAARENHE